MCISIVFNSWSIVNRFLSCFYAFSVQASHSFMVIHFLEPLGATCITSVKMETTVAL